MTHIHFIVLVTLLAANEFGASAGESLQAFATSLRVKGLTNEVIRIRVGKIEQSFAKRGVFRLGILPTVRLQEVSLTFETGRGLNYFGDALSKANEIGIGKKVELGQMTVECMESPHFKVNAVSVERLTENRIAFAGPVILVTSGATNRFVRAELRCERGKWLVSGSPSSTGLSVTNSVILQ